MEPMVLGVFFIFVSVAIVVCIAIKRCENAVSAAAAVGALILVLMFVFVAPAEAESTSGILAGVDFRTNEVSVISHGEVFAYKEDKVDKDDVLFGKDVVFDENGNAHLRMGCRVAVNMDGTRIEDVKYTGLIVKTDYVYELVDQQTDEVVGYAVNEKVAINIAENGDLEICKIPQVYNY